MHITHRKWTSLRKFPYNLRITKVFSLNTNTQTLLWIFSASSNRLATFRPSRISNVSDYIAKHVDTVESAPIRMGTTVTFIFHFSFSFSTAWIFSWVSHFFFSVSLWFSWNHNINYLTDIPFFLYGDWICLGKSVWISNSSQILFFLFLGQLSIPCVYHCSGCVIRTHLHNN